MAWSVPEPPPAAPVLGDPASLAALALALRRSAGEIDRAVEDLDLTTITSRHHRSRARTVVRDVSALTAAMSRSAAALSDHAGELADAIGLSTRLVDRARATGLVVDGPTISRATGVQGVADPQSESNRAEALRRLQPVLDAILLDLDTARRRLRTELERERPAVRNR